MVFWGGRPACGLCYVGEVWSKNGTISTRSWSRGKVPVIRWILSAFVDPATDEVGNNLIPHTESSYKPQR